MAIEKIYSKCVNAGLSNIMINRITTFYELVGDNLIFGRKDIAEYLNFSYSNAGKIIVSILNLKCVSTVEETYRGIEKEPKNE